MVALIIDIAWDEGTACEWVKPTTSADPLFKIGHNINYYAVGNWPRLD
ncbi:hypothetical protein ACXA45_11355 [Neomicrococcus lactis]